MSTAALTQPAKELAVDRSKRVEQRPRERAGWRAGRPLEDPHKMKRWGYVSAKPSEYLVHVRRGRMTARSGQGATCFKWPWDSVAVIPTSLQRLSFCADQITAEKVGVEVMGFAVYRMADPKQAYRVLNFSFPERAQEKLEQTLTAMFVGATRRLVANLSVEQCLQKRKSALAQELLREIAPVVGGLGRAQDVTDRGWGVVIDTIEIQEVRVLSEAVFAAMQAPFRAALDREARAARAQAEQAIAATQATCEREIQQAQIDADEAIRKRKAAADRAAAEIEAATALRRAELRAQRERGDVAAAQAVKQAQLEADAAICRQQVALEREQEEGQTRLDVRRSELSAEAAHAALAAHEACASRQTRHAELQGVLAAMEAELRQLRAAAELSEGQSQAEVQLRHAEAAVRNAEADAKRLAAQNLPKLAAAMGERISEVKIAQYGTGEHPFAQFATALRAFLDLVERS